MTTTKISELTSSSGVSNSDLFITVVSGAGGYVTRKTTGLQLAQFASSSITSLNLTSLTASNIDSANITADTLTVDTLTAREYHTQVVSASVIYQSGSTKFGNSADDTHVLTGSVLVNGGINLVGDLVASSGQFTSVTGSHVGSGAGLTNIPNAALTNSSVTVGSTTVSLGGTATTITGLTAITSSAVSGNTAQFTSITGTLNGLVTNVTTVTTSSNVSSNNHFILVNASTGAITITLPNASTVPNREYAFKKTDSTSNIVTISGSSGQTLDGEAFKQITTQYEAFFIVSNGSNWFVF